MRREALLGTLQGVAEVYPVSSSAQLSLVPWLLRWPPTVDRTGFAAGLHAGSAVGVALALRHDLRKLERREWGWLALSTVPAVLAGYAGHEAVEERFADPGTTAAALAGAGALLWFADWGRERTSVRASDVATAALAQVPALIPGVSRAGATLTAFRLRGVNRDQAWRTSLLMSLPVTLGAAGLTAVRARRVPPLAPSLLAAAASYAAVKTLRPTRQAVQAAVLYRLGLAAAVAVRRRKEHG